MKKVIIDLEGVSLPLNFKYFERFELKELKSTYRDYVDEYKGFTYVKTFYKPNSNILKYEKPSGIT